MPHTLDHLVVHLKHVTTLAKFAQVPACHTLLNVSPPGAIRILGNRCVGRPRQVVCSRIAALDGSLLTGINMGEN